MPACARCEFRGKYQKPEVVIGTNQVLLVGESPKGSLNKSLQSISMRRLSQLLSSIGFDLTDCSFTELCKCEVSDRKQLPLMGKACYPRLAKEIRTKKYRLVISIGLETAKVITAALELPLRMGKLARCEGYYYFPLYHTSPINPINCQRNLEFILSNKTAIEKLLSSQ